MMQVMIFRAIIHEPPSVPVPRRPDTVFVGLAPCA